MKRNHNSIFYWTVSEFRITLWDFGVRFHLNYKSLIYGLLDNNLPASFQLIMCVVCFKLKKTTQAIGLNQVFYDSAMVIKQILGERKIFRP